MKLLGFYVLSPPRLKLCDDELERRYPEYRRESNSYKPRTFFMAIQPVPAVLGLVGCLLFFGFTSATWWDTPATFPKVAVAFAAVRLPYR